MVHTMKTMWILLRMAGYCSCVMATLHYNYNHYFKYFQHLNRFQKLISNVHDNDHTIKKVQSLVGYE